jgi:phosphoglycolate phosphatase
MAQRGVIFDLDGTLLDTLDDINVAVNELMECIGRPPVTRRRLDSIVGRGMANMLSRASGIEEPERVQELVAAFRPIYAGQMLEQTRPYDGVPEMLDRLTAANVPLAVLSNKAHEYTVAMCRELLGRWSFVRFQGQTEDRPRKPDPGVALELVEAMECHSGATYFVGDSIIDVTTGRNAGTITVGVRWGCGTEDEFRGADHVINRPAELADLLQLP